MTKTYITRGSGLRARKQPTTDAAIVGMFPQASRLAVDHNVTVGEDIWHALPVAAGGVGLRDPGDIGAPAYVWAAHRYRGTDYTDAEVVDPPPPATPTQTYPAWGMNYPNGNLHLVEPAWQGGARAFLIIDDFMFATQLSQRFGAFVVARRGQPQPYLTGNLAEDVQRNIQWLEGAAGGPTMKYVGLNEGDKYGFSVGEIVYRAKFDVAMAHRVRDISGATWVAASFAVGNPEYNDPNICRVMRDGYAEAYNSGLLMIDYHNYERNPEDIDKPLDERRWYSMRHLFLFGQGTDRCGFDPRVKGIVHCESGVDGGAGGREPGGFSQFGMTGAQVVAFHRSAYRNAGAPILVDGQWYESPVVAGMHFQCGSDQWRGFEMRGYLSDMAGNWTPGKV